MYKDKAQSTLAEMFDYAINDYGLDGQEFIDLFMTSTISKRMEKGDVEVILGKSGIENAIDMISETKTMYRIAEPRVQYARSKEYWIGWAIAYYQWYSNRKYQDIFEVLDYQNLTKMYKTLHECDLSKVCEVFDSYLLNAHPETKLKRLRVDYGFSQSELSKESGVSLRSIQMYEQQHKDINKASAETILRLAKALGCDMEELMENRSSNK